MAEGGADRDQNPMTHFRAAGKNVPLRGEGAAVGGLAGYAPAASVTRGYSR
jgi:hypothetical protein